MDPQFELDPQALGASTATRTIKKAAKRKVHHFSKSSGKNGTVYTIKPGDHLFKILMRDYGLSNDQAEAFIDEVCRENNIHDIKRLRIGQKITIPDVRRSVDKVLPNVQPGEENEGLRTEEGSGSLGQALRLDVPSAPVGREAAVQIKEVWDKLVPSGTDLQSPISVQSPSFSLTLDSRRYPVYASMDGAKIVVDPTASIPPLVRSLITEKDPTVRIVSGSSDNRQFLADMLKSAKFYSVEEDFSVVFGGDPKLTVKADFKVEKTPESLVRQDVALINSSESPLPDSLTHFLKKEGFTVHEPFAVSKTFSSSASRLQVHQVTAKKQSDVVDALLQALSINNHVDRTLDVFAADNNGISLSVLAERYFERGGRRYVITRFDGDPVTYTLFRILETKGYQVVILEAQDNFRKISEKILSRMNIRGSFVQNALLSRKDLNYSLQVSGFKMEGDDIPGGSLFLTDLELNQVVRDMLRENGYQVHEHK
ncbi:LysM peptidoglycan-binding domain-containing protein [Pelotalea chapellei]|uniref:LysM peptidoglycan-binding domain-containing protein n=1 Tax=Pelotalea chapellei TaxID=44671 RepID=A0ABS5U5V3_9BACT|nr:LysM domain-containing protein [Pelotalea chapellei]MBT1071039.1 LysM peptidoglycan-binding domain-containing protein [Pelotalea chapellei]